MKSKRKKMIKIQNGEQMGVERAWRGERDIFNFFSLFFSFSDLWKSDRRFLSEQKAMLDYMTRTKRRYQYLSVSSNFKR